MEQTTFILQYVVQAPVTFILAFNTVHLTTRDQDSFMNDSAMVLL